MGFTGTINTEFHDSLTQSLELHQKSLQQVCG